MRSDAAFLPSVSKQQQQQQQPASSSSSSSSSTPNTNLHVAGSSSPPPSSSWQKQHLNHSSQGMATAAAFAAAISVSSSSLSSPSLLQQQQQPSPLTATTTSNAVALAQQMKQKQKEKQKQKPLSLNKKKKKKEMVNSWGALQRASDSCRKGSEEYPECLVGLHPLEKVEFDGDSAFALVAAAALVSAASFSFSSFSFSPSSSQPDFGDNSDDDDKDLDFSTAGSLTSFLRRFQKTFSSGLSFVWTTFVFAFSAVVALLVWLSSLQDPFLSRFGLARILTTKTTKKELSTTADGDYRGGDDGGSNTQQQQQHQQQQELPRCDGEGNLVVGKLRVSSDTLGHGSLGTIVFRGHIDGRPVAVKRLLSEYHAAAEREIRLLIESDGHPNVVRYFMREAQGSFV
jgi:hypothetical protein